jgi:hypothetical protein
MNRASLRLTHVNSLSVMGTKRNEGQVFILHNPRWARFSENKIIVGVIVKPRIPASGE